MTTDKRIKWAIALFCTAGLVHHASGDQSDLEVLQQAGNGGDATPAGAISPPEPDVENVEVSRYDTVSLSVQGTDLSRVLQMLSVQGQRNIVPSPQVSGTVTANLYDVTFHEALDAILRQNGAGYVERGNFIFVYTNDELEQIQDAERELSTQVVHLDYLTAEDASTFIEPLRSNAGTVAMSGQVAAGFEPTISDGGANMYAAGEMLVIRDYAENIESMASLIEELDTPPKQVLVEATILQANLTEDLAFGVDMAILGEIGLGDPSGSVLNVVNDMITGNITDTPSGAGTSTVGNVADGPGGVRFGVLTNNVQVFVRALDQITDTVVLANPKVMTLNRQRAEVLVGERVAYVSTTATATATTQTVEFLDTGTQLTLRPFISRDGMIRMELRPQISTFELRQAGGGDGVVTLPDEITQELTTNVMVRDGETIVLGGLFQEETTINRNQVPGLGDIPILGAAFTGQDDEVRKSEVIFLITPHIIEDNRAYAAGERARDGAELVRIGAREGLLPWSRQKMTAGNVRDALRYIDEGDHERALWEVDVALNLDPNLVEARRLREKLTGERAYWPDRSLLDETVDYMVREHEMQRAGHRHVPVVPDPTPALPGTELPAPVDEDLFQGELDVMDEEAEAEASTDEAADESEAEAVADAEEVAEKGEESEADSEGEASLHTREEAAADAAADPEWEDDVAAEDDEADVAEGSADAEEELSAVDLPEED